MTKIFEYALIFLFIILAVIFFVYLPNPVYGISNLLIVFGLLLNKQAAFFAKRAKEYPTALFRFRKIGNIITVTGFVMVIMNFMFILFKK